MHPFEVLSLVHTTLKHLMEREPPLVTLLPRQPGTKEARYAHLLSGNVDTQESPLVQPNRLGAVSKNFVDAGRVARLESEVADLQREIADLKLQFAEFRKQFE